LAALRVPAQHGAALEARFRASTKGGVQYVEMLNTALPSGSGERWRSEERLRAMIRRRFEWRAPGRLRRAFRHFDAGRAGKVTERDLADGLRALKLALSSEQDHSLFEAMDLDGDGCIDYAEFVVFVRDPCHRFLEQKVKYAVATAGTSANAARRALDDLDTNASGLLGPADFGRALQRLGVDISSSERARLALRFDAHEDGNVSVQRFFAFLKGDREGAESTDEPRGLAALRNELRRIAQQRGGPPDYGRLFREFDKDGSGAIDRREFRRGLESMGFALSGADLTAVMEHFDKDGDGVVSIRDFVKFVVHDGPAAPRDVDAVLRKAVSKLAGGRGGGLRKAFEKFDANGSGRVSRGEFRREIESLGLDVSPAEVDGILDRFDKDKDGSLDYREFVSFFADEQNAETQGLVSLRDEIKRLSRRGNGRAPDYAKVFRAFDVDGSGGVDRREFRAGLEDMGFELNSQDLTAVLDHFDANGDGKISVAEFARFAESDVVGKVATALRREMRRLKRRKGGDFALKDAFRRIDRNGSGAISRGELDAELDRLGVRLTARELDDVLARFDRDGDGRVDYDEFSRFAETAKPGEDAILDRLRALVRRALGDGLSLGDCFKHFDRDGSGDLDELEFERGLKKLGVSVTSIEVAHLMDEFASRRSGCIRYEDFSQAVSPAGESEPEGVAAVRSEVRRLAKSRSGAPDYARVFRDLDRDGAGALSARDLRRGLERMGFEVSAADVDHLAQHLDRNGDGVVSIREFVKFAAGDGDASNALRTLRREVDRFSRSRNFSLRGAFADLDRDGSGRVSGREFKRELSRLGFEVSAAELDDLVMRFDADGDGLISYEEFVRLAEGDDDRDDARDVGARDDDDVLCRLRRLVRDAADDGLSVADCFEHFDRDGSGDLDEDEFERGLKKLKIRVTDKELRSLLARFVSRETGRIRYRDFCDAVGPSASPRKASRSAPPEAEGVRRLRAEMRRLAASRAGAPDYSGVLLEYDRSGAGVLDRKALRKGLAALGLEDVSSADLTAIVSHFDAGGDGAVDVRDFAQFAKAAERDGGADRDWRDGGADRDRRAPTSRSRR